MNGLHLVHLTIRSMCSSQDRFIVKIEELQNCFSISIGVRVTFQIEALVRCHAIDFAEALEPCLILNESLKKRGMGVAVSMLRKFHSKPTLILWNLDDLDEEVSFCECAHECDEPASSSLKPSNGNLT